MKVLLLDNYDSFTYMLKDYIAQCGAQCNVLRNDEIDLQNINKLQYDAMVISPGPKTPNDAGNLMQTIGFFEKKIPILGICLGHQALAQFYGANIIKLTLPRHGKVDKMKHMQGLIYNNIPTTFMATRYHSLVINNIPQCLKINCISGNEIMGIEHTSLPIYGIQFHPESCQTEYGLQMIKNFITSV